MKQTIQGIDKTGSQATFEYDDTKMLTEGGEGKIYFSTDKKHVIKLYNDRINRKIEHMEQILQSTPDPNHEAAEALAWITHVIFYNNRVMGIVTPNAGQSQWMENMIWYMKYELWESRPVDQRGDYRGFVQMLHQMAVGVRYLNFTGFGHADLSGRNVLCNPVAGKAAVIDMDGLVVTGYMTGDVGGTPGFMAPELVDGYVGGIPTVPTNITDRHALAVIIFHVLLWRHPLIGKRPPLSNDLEHDNLLQQCSQHALYVHHPTDHSNSMAQKGYLPLEMLPKEMQDLFAQTFIDGLRNPSKRPHPDDWVIALRNLEDDLIACTNSACLLKYFPSLDGTAKTCPICGAQAKIAHKSVGTLTVLYQSGNGAYPVKARAVSEIKLKKRPDPLTRATLFGKSVSNGSKPVLQLSNNGKSWDVTLQDKEVQVILVGDTHTHLTPKRLSVNNITAWEKHQVAIITMSQHDITCLVKLE